MSAGTPSRCGGGVRSATEFVLPLTEGNRRLESPPWADQPDVHLRTVCRRRGDRLVVELALVNDQAEPDRRRDTAWLFQTRLEVTGVEGAPSIFLPADGQMAGGELLQEDQHLAMLYRHALEYAVGRNVAVAVESKPELGRASRLTTEWFPTFDVPQTVTPSLEGEARLAGLEVDMQRLAELEPEKLRSALGPLAAGYEEWLEDQERRVGSDSDLQGHRGAAAAAIAEGRGSARRIRAGLDLLATDPLALEAWRFANQAMALQRVHTEIGLLRRQDPTVTYEQAVTRSDLPAKRSWRPFQLAFVLLNLPALTDPAHPERSPLSTAKVDLLFFPTGGGKTEAYLGLSAYTFAIRRLQGVVGSGPGARDGAEGVAVLMRYTLRLLTAQQFQRAATLLCACEYLRQGRRAAGDPRWGETPFRIGLWVGQAASPNSYDDAATQIRSARGQGRGTGNRVLQLLSCPWCARELTEAHDLEPQDQERRVYLHCSDPDGGCPFSRRQSPEGIPVLTVDEEIYRLMPVMVIGTVDKLAQLPWRGQAGMVFGRATRRCTRHGFRHADLDSVTGCADAHRATDRLPAGSTALVVQPRPPDLIIQDELHLISGALGTMVGLYETMVDELCSWTSGAARIRPKIISSTATVRRAQQQVHQLFGRHLGIFPPPMLDAGDTFFSVQVPVSEAAPGRRYRGICAHGIRLKQAEIRLTTTLLTATQYLFDLNGEAADPYFTCVAYFNSLRELAGMKRLLDDDIAVRVRRAGAKGLASRPTPLEVQELASRMPSSRIAETLRQLEEVAQPAFDSTAARQQKPRPERPGRFPIAVLLATNMLQVGVDVARLGLMVVTGQPKNTAEYIQATSRVGRVADKPGLILTLYNWARPRDLAHFESFGHYHETFHRQVEPLSVTPFAARAVDRGLTGVLAGMIRHAELGFSPNLAAQRVDLSGASVTSVVEAIARRAGQISASAAVEDRVRDAIRDRLDHWLQRRAHIEASRLGYRTGPDVEGLLHEAGLDDWDRWTVAYSLRETEPEANLVLPQDTVVDHSTREATNWVFAEQGGDDADLEPENPADETPAAPVGTVSE